MLKNSKKLLAALLSVLLTFSGVISAFAAVTWEPMTTSDWWVNESFDNNFNMSNTTNWGQLANTTLDSSTFSADADHKAVLNVPSAKYIQIKHQTVRDNLATANKIRIKFDYKLQTSSGNLRVEVRDLNGDLLINGDASAKYWTGDRTQVTISSTEWDTFDGVFDLAQYKEDLSKLSGFTGTTTTSAYIMIYPSVATYIDNIQIGQVPDKPNALTMANMSISDKWTKQSDNNDATTKHFENNVYMGTETLSTENSINCDVANGEMSGYFKTGETYRISFDFWEDANNSQETTRLWRFMSKSKNTDIQLNGSPSGYLYTQLTQTTGGSTPKGWTHIDRQFTLDENNVEDKALATDGLFVLKWNGHKVSTAGDFKIYIANFSISCVSENIALNKTVEHSSSITPDTDGGLSVSVGGYPDTTVAPKLKIGSETITGTWNGKTASFTGIDAENYLAAGGAELAIVDKWGDTITTPVTLNYTTEHTDKLEFFRGNWTNIFARETEVAPTDNGWLKNEADSSQSAVIALKDYITQGSGLIRFSFDAKGTVSDAKNIQLRTVSGGEVTIQIPANDLSADSYKTYSTIVDVGGLGRYSADSNGMDRLGNYQIYLRDGITYNNIKVDYFDADADTKPYVTGRLKVKNIGTMPYRPNGVLVFAVYDGNNMLTDVQFRNISYTDSTKSGTPANSLAEGEGKYIYITGNEASSKTVGTETVWHSPELESYDANSKYRLFYWDSLSGMQPIAAVCDEITVKGPATDVLIIGNSFSLDSARYVHEIAEDLGENINVTVYEIGGAPAQKHYNLRENTTDWQVSKNGGSSAKTNVSLDTYLTNNDFDIVVLQNWWGSNNGIAQYEATTDIDLTNLHSAQPGYNNLASYVKEKQPDAEIMINAIWSDEKGYPVNSYVENGYTDAGFDAANKYAYDLIEKYNGQAAIDIGASGKPVRQIPTGFAIATARDCEVGGVKIFDTTFNVSDRYGYTPNDNMTFAEVAGETADDTLNRDGYHLSLAGRYLAGCVWVEALTGKDVRNTTVVPTTEVIRAGYTQDVQQADDTYLATINVTFPSLKTDRAELLREIAHNAVEKFYSQPTRGLDDPSLER